MSWLYRVASALVLVFGGVLVASDVPDLATGPSGEMFFLQFPGITAAIGLTFAVIAVLNLVNDRYGRDTRGLKSTTAVIDILAAIILIRWMSLNASGWPAAAVSAPLIVMAVTATRRAQIDLRKRAAQ